MNKPRKKNQLTKRSVAKRQAKTLKHAAQSSMRDVTYRTFAKMLESLKLGRFWHAGAIFRVNDIRTCVFSETLSNALIRASGAICRFEIADSILDD